MSENEGIVTQLNELTAALIAGGWNDHNTTMTFTDMDGVIHRVTQVEGIMILQPSRSVIQLR